VTAVATQMSNLSAWGLEIVQADGAPLSLELAAEWPEETWITGPEELLREAKIHIDAARRVEAKKKPPRHKPRWLF